MGFRPLSPARKAMRRAAARSSPTGRSDFACCATADRSRRSDSRAISRPILRARRARCLGQLRLRIVDASRLNADTIMPPYYRTDGLARVAPAFRGKTILTAEQIEDVIAYLLTLRD